MLSCCVLVAAVLGRVRGEAETEQQQYLDTVQSQWKQYRNLVKDGFIYNDSIVVMSDYDEAEAAVEAATNLGDIPKLGFETTLMGMVTALQEIQNKGDEMMLAISDQKKVLVRLRSEVDKAELRLAETTKVTQEIEMKRSEAESEIRSAERDTRMLSRRKESLEAEVARLDQERAEVTRRLEALQAEAAEVRAEMAEVTRVRGTLDPLQESFRTRQLELASLEDSLQTKTAELIEVQRQIEDSTTVLNDIKTSLALAPSTSVETKVPAVSPYLVPALVVSLLLNLVTGGAIVSNYMEPGISRQDTEQAEDTDPYQFISSSIFELVSGGAALSDYIQEGGDQDQPLQFSSDTLGAQQPPSPAFHQLHDKMDRHESSLQYIGGGAVGGAGGGAVGGAAQPEQRFSDMFTQDAYYDLPRHLPEYYF